MLIYPENLTDIIGIGTLVVIFIIQYLQGVKTKLESAANR